MFYLSLLVEIFMIAYRYDTCCSDQKISILASLVRYLIRFNHLEFWGDLVSK